MLRGTGEMTYTPSRDAKVCLLVNNVTNIQINGVSIAVASNTVLFWVGAGQGLTVSIVGGACIMSVLGG